MASSLAVTLLDQGRKETRKPKVQAPASWAAGHHVLPQAGISLCCLCQSTEITKGSRGANSLQH